jgi:hypothetical protein
MMNKEVKLSFTVAGQFPKDNMCAANPLKGCNNGNNSCAAIDENRGNKGRCPFYGRAQSTGKNIKYQPF